MERVHRLQLSLSLRAAVEAEAVPTQRADWPQAICRVRSLSRWELAETRVPVAQRVQPVATVASEVTRRSVPI